MRDIISPKYRLTIQKKKKNFKGEIGYTLLSIEITDHFQYGDNKITISVQDPTDKGFPVT